MLSVDVKLVIYRKPKNTTPSEQIQSTMGNLKNERNIETSSTHIIHENSLPLVSPCGTGIEKGGTYVNDREVKSNV